MARSKIGFHTGPGGNKNGLGDWERTLNRAGQPFGMKAADEYGPLHEAVQVGREHNIRNWLGFRMTKASGKVSREVPDYNVAPAEDARRLCQEVIDKLPPEFDRSVWLEIINEPRAENKGDDTMFGSMNACDYLGQWCLAAARFLNERGFRFMGPSFNAGEPGREGLALQDAVTQYEQTGMLDYLRYCAANPDQAALSLHEYSWSRWKEGQTAPDWYPALWGRFEAAIAAADRNGIPRTFHIFVTEFGFAHDAAPSGTDAWPYLDARNQMTARWSQIKYDAAWTLQEGWDAVDQHVNSWMQYDAGKQFDEGAQPARTHAVFGGTLPGAMPAPAPAPAGRFRVITAPDGLNLRREPIIDPNNVKRPVAFGTRVEVLEDHGEWLFVRVNGDTGFMSARFLGGAEPGDPAPVAMEETPTPGGRFRVITAPAGLNLRREPVIDANNVKRKVPHGTMVEVLEDHGEWLLVRVDGDTGFLSAQFLGHATPGGAEPVTPPPPPAPAPGGAFRYTGPPTRFFTALHGPASDHVWHDPAFVIMIQQLEMPLLFMSSGINPDFAHFGNPARNIVRLHYNPNPQKTDPEAVYQEIRDDQLRRWWEKGYRRFIFFNEVNMPLGVGQSAEGLGILWHTPAQFASFLRHCLLRAREEHPGIQLYTTPMSPSFDVWAWRQAMWDSVRDIVSGYAMHAYSGNNDDAAIAAREIAGEATELQRRLRLHVPLVITEASVNRGHNAQQKAQVAHRLPDHLGSVPGIEGVFWYVADWAGDFDVNHEGWFRKGIADAYLQQRGAVHFAPPRPVAARPTRAAMSDSALRALAGASLPPRGVMLHRDFALYKAIRRDGYVAAGDECEVEIDGVRHVAQLAEHPDEERGPRVYLAIVNDWENIRFLDDALHQPETPGDRLLYEEALSRRGVSLQRAHGLYRALRRDRHVAVDDEFFFTAGDHVYAAQFAEHPDMVGEARAYVCLAPNWESVWWLGAPQRDQQALERDLLAFWQEGGFDSPVGTEEERRGAGVWPAAWHDATPYLTRYTFGDPPREAIHTGADLNMAGDADRDRPVYACAAGTVTYARLVGSSTWGRLAVIRHVLPDGRVVHSRYGHLRKLLVSENEQVHRGQQIGTIGGKEYGVANHLHFDISLTGILEARETAVHWPGLNEQAVRDHYVEPAKFIRAHRPVAPAEPRPLASSGAPELEPFSLSIPAISVTLRTRIVTARAGLHLREGPAQATASLLRMVAGTEVEILEEGPWARVRLNNLVGYAFSGWLAARKQAAPPDEQQSGPEEAQAPAPREPAG